MKFNIHAIFVNKTKFFSKVLCNYSTGTIQTFQAGPKPLPFNFFFFLFFYCCSYSKGAVEQIASALLCCPELQAFTWGGAVRISACKPSIPSIQSICTVNVHLCLSLPLQPLWHWPQVSLAGLLQSQQSEAERSHHWLQIQNIGWGRGLLWIYQWMDVRGFIMN